MFVLYQIRRDRPVAYVKLRAWLSLACSGGLLIALSKPVALGVRYLTELRGSLAVDDPEFLDRALEAPAPEAASPDWLQLGLIAAGALLLLLSAYRCWHLIGQPGEPPPPPPLPGDGPFDD